MTDARSTISTHFAWPTLLQNPYAEQQAVVNTSNSVASDENAIVMMELTEMFSRHGGNDALVTKKLNEELKTFLANRWEYIRGTDLAYPYAPAAQANIICINLARQIEDLDRGDYPYHLLMPTVVEANLLENRDFNKLMPQEFVLTDDDRGFISVAATKALAADAKDVLQTYVNDEETYLRVLTESEKQRYLKRAASADGNYHDEVSLEKVKEIISAKQGQLTAPKPSAVPSVGLTLKDEKDSVPPQPAVETDEKDGDHQNEKGYVPISQQETSYEKLNSTILLNLLSEQNEMLNNKSLFDLLFKRNNKEKDLEAALNYLNVMMTRRNGQMVSEAKLICNEIATARSNTLSPHELTLLTELAYRTAIVIKKPNHIGNVARGLEISDTLQKKKVSWSRILGGIGVGLFGVVCLCLSVVPLAVLVVGFSSLSSVASLPLAASFMNWMLSIDFPAFYGVGTVVAVCAAIWLLGLLYLGIDLLFRSSDMIRSGIQPSDEQRAINSLGLQAHGLFARQNQQQIDMAPVAAPALHAQQPALVAVH